MKRNLEKSVRKGMAIACGLLACYSCSDTWDEHYDANAGVVSSQTLWQQIEADPNLSNFAQVLKATKVYSHHQKSNLSYADLLAGDQSFTVFAPVISEATRDSLLRLCQTDAGDSAVEKAFVKNHVARYVYSVGAATNENVTLFNTKVKDLTFQKIGEANLTARNLVAKNGVMHTVDRQIPYFRNLYEYVTNEPEHAQLGSFLQAYQRDSLDEKASVVGSINEDGETVYVDSVMIENNPLLNEIGFINREDSTYWMIAPTDKAWNDIYAKIEPYFYYAYIDNADSLQHYRTRHAIVNDLAFNAHLQRAPQDSLISSPYTSREPERHVFYNPYGANGIMAPVQRPAVACSNGLVYRTDVWPFDPTETFFTPIKVEGERTSNITDYTACSYNVRTAVGDSISRNGYIDLVPTASASNPTVTYEIPNTLRGRYDVCVVLLPKTVYNANTDDFKPNCFRAAIYYRDSLGIEKSESTTTLFYNDPYRVDTVCVAENFEFKTCNYGQDNVTTHLKITSNVRSTQRDQYSREFYIDCIYLIPRKD